jgi:hypothetical protein
VAAAARAVSRRASARSRRQGDFLNEQAAPPASGGGYDARMSAAERDPLAEWRSIAVLVQDRVRGATDAELDRRPGDGAMTLRETVHHIVEANVVAAGIVTAALGSPGCVFDWSWMLPFGPWMENLRYDRKPIAPAVTLLAALNAWVQAQLAPLPDGLQRTVRLLDAPGTEPRNTTVADVLLQEAEHAREHLGAAAAE